MGVPVTVVDYGVGNLLSVLRALEHCGASPVATDDPRAIANAERLLLPGVGAFADGMQGLRERGLIDAIRQQAQTARPLLGICLGMQLLASHSEEFGLHAGLNIIPGVVTAIPRTDLVGRPQKIPHIGWSDLVQADGATWHDSLLAAIRPRDAVYLVHSYEFRPEREENLLAVCMYGGRPIAAAISSGAVTGCQFHPEKSGEVGLKILRKFIAG